MTVFLLFLGNVNVFFPIPPFRVVKRVVGLLKLKHMSLSSITFLFNESCVLLPMSSTSYSTSGHCKPRQTLAYLVHDTLVLHHNN
jgi:hypothetical protein